MTAVFRSVVSSSKSANSWIRRVSEAPEWLVALALFLLGLVVRLGDLDAMVNVDMYYLWSRRTTHFMEAFASGDFARTYQSHHPGVTLMWLMGGMWSLFGMLDVPIQLHPEKVRLAVWPIVVVGSLFAAVSYPLLVRLLGQNRRLAAFLACLLLCTEPLLVAHSRNSHLDILASSFAWLAIWCALIAKREGSWSWAASGGVLLGLALMSKVSTAGFALGIALSFLVAAMRRPRLGMRLLQPLTLIVVLSVVTMIAIWPALWTAPIETLRLQREGLNKEVEKTILFMLMGKAGKMAVPVWVYGVFVIFLVTPEIWLPGVLGGPLLLRAEPRVRSFVLDLFLVVAPLCYLVFRSNNIGVRNTILWLPLFALLTALAADEVRRHMSVHWPKAVLWGATSVLLLLGVGRVMRLISLYPLPIAYCSSWTQTDCSNVFHVGWGEGLKEAAAYLERYAHETGKKPRIYGSDYGPIVRVWTDVALAKKSADADLLLDYAPDWQRQTRRARDVASYAEEHGLNLIHTVKLQGRDYVRIYENPREMD